MPSATTTEATPSPTIKPLEVFTSEDGWKAECEAFSIEVEEIYIGASRCYIADVMIRDMACMRAAYAYDTFESKRREVSSEMAKRWNAVIAINGDYYSYRSDGIIVRNGSLDRNRPKREMLAIYDDGHMEIVDETKVDIELLMARGLLHTFSFGPTLVRDGKAIEDFSSSKVKNSNPRTGVGQIEPGHFIFIVVDGRQDDSHGMTLSHYAQVFEDYGCELAYNFDGGASSEMIFLGEPINQPSGNLAVAQGSERTISDILFLAEP